LKPQHLLLQKYYEQSSFTFCWSLGQNKRGSYEQIIIGWLNSMSERNSSIEEITQKIDQLLFVLKDISQDLAEISEALKAVRPPSPVLGTAPAPTTAWLESSSIQEVREMFSKELEEMLFFEDTDECIIIKPRRFLGSENFAKIASIVRGAGGEYVSAGRDSHFKISKVR
jgi:hypothetical protein